MNMSLKTAFGRTIQFARTNNAPKSQIISTRLILNLNTQNHNTERK